MRQNQENVKKNTAEKTKKITAVEEDKAKNTAEDIRLKQTNSVQGQKRRKKTGKKKKQRKRIHPLFKLLIKIALFAAIAFVVLTYILGLHRMTGNNMFPFVKDGDLCIVYKLDDYYTGDVVSYYDNNGKLKIGRIVAAAGQEVNFPDEGGYTVDGYQPTEEITYQTFGAEGVKYPIEVGENEVFIMNDFRSDTKDSREIGPVKKTDIDGKLMFIVRRRGF